MNSSLFAMSSVWLRTFSLAPLLVAGVVALSGCPRQVQGDADAGVDAGPTGPIACADDEQCNGGFCRGGICVDEECQERGQCADTQVCKEGRCSDPPEVCVDATDCPANQLCDGFTDRCFDPNGPAEGEGDVVVGEGEGDGPVGEGEGEPGVGIDLSGFRLENREQAVAQQVTVLPDGIFLDVGDVLVIGRDASQGEFTTFWGSFAGGAQYLNGATDSGVPIINGAEKFTLVAPNGDVIDGPARVGAEKKCYGRTGASAGADTSWTEGSTTEATPGAINAPGVHGLVITEWCDAEGSGNFVFEYIEIANLP